MEPVFNVLPNVNNRQRDKFVNTLLNVAAAKGILPDGTRPMWPQRPVKPTQIQELPTSSVVHQSQFNPSTAHITPALQKSFPVTSSRSPIQFPETFQFEPNQNFIKSQEHNPTQQYNGFDRRLVLTDPAQNNFQYIDQNVASQGQGDRTTITNLNTNQYGNYPNTFIIPPEYLNSVQSSGFPVVFPGPDPSVTQYPTFMGTSENDVLGPSLFPAPIPFAPMAYPPFVVSPPNVLPFNGGIPSPVIINPSQNEITNAVPEISYLSIPVAQSNLDVQYVPYNLELDLPVYTTLIPTSDSEPLTEYLPQIPSNVPFPPIEGYPPFPFPPQPMPFLPPIIIQQQGTKSKSKDLLKIFLLARLLPFGFGGKNKCGCD